MTKLTIEERRAKAKESWKWKNVKKTLKRMAIVFGTCCTVMLIIVIIAAVHDNSKPTAKADIKTKPKPKVEQITQSNSKHVYETKVWAIAEDKTKTEAEKLKEVDDYAGNFLMNIDDWDFKERTEWLAMIHNELLDDYTNYADDVKANQLPLKTKLIDYFLTQATFVDAGPDNIKELATYYGDALNPIHNKAGYNPMQKADKAYKKIEGKVFTN